ncbi:MAG TPA: M3 family metallopeptidase [Gammaproteobacteria bacterium]
MRVVLLKQLVRKLGFSVIAVSLLLVGCDWNQSEAVTEPETVDRMAANFTDECERNLAASEKHFRDIENYQGPLTTEAFLQAVDRLGITFDNASSKAGLYENVHPNAYVRTAAEECVQKFSKLATEISLSRPYYDNLRKVNISKADPVTQRYVEHMLRDFRRAGVDKDPATRDRIRKLKEEIVKLGQDFGRNIREDVRHIELDSAEELEGLPEDYIKAHPVNENGKIIITTDYPDYIPFMQYAKSDTARLELYKQFRKRGYPANEAVLAELLQKRHELAKILGYRNYAEYITEDKMIKTPENAQQFIDKITSIAEQRAKQDYAVLLQRLTKIQPEATEVGDWQKTYIEELIKQEKYQIDSRELRQYFMYKDVREGIFNLAETLFGITIRPWKTDNVWHSSVEAYEVYDDDQLIGRFYLDMHPRDGKYKHAAHFGIQQGVKGIQVPISALICNFPGGDGSPGYMEHDHVETFLHEFGHLLHGIFAGQQPWLGISGISTEWDFVEAPSQMLEEWVWDADTLQSFAVNAEGETLPDALIDKMREGRHFGRGLWVKHQMFYAALSLNYYNRNPDEIDLNELAIDLQNRYSPFKYVDDTYFYASFGHLDGYSAIYYTYMWSLVIASDMFSEFKKHGLRNTDVAARYREKVLAPGGSKDAADLVRDFLGRPYSFTAFEKELNNPADI